MNKESLKEINELSEYLEIPKDEFKMILLLALKYQNENGQIIHEEKLYQIIEEALNNIDYPEVAKYDVSITSPKTIEEAFNRALINLGYQKTKKK